MNIIIRVDNDQWQRHLVNLDTERITSTIKEYTKAYTNGDITVLFTDNNQIKILNNNFRGKNAPTNVLSFPFNDDDGMMELIEGVRYLGDIAIALETIESEAETAQICVLNHTIHMITHGILHILGYDHMNDAEANIMESLEIKILNDLGIKNPYQNI